MTKKLENLSTNFIVYDIETYNDKNNKATPYSVSLYRLSKHAGKYNRGLTPYEYEKRKKDTIVFIEENWITKMSDYLLILKGEPKKVGNKNC